jgi:hypothetical protein
MRLTGIRILGMLMRQIIVTLSQTILILRQGTSFNRLLW